MFSATVLYRHEKHWKYFIMKFSTNITIFNIVNKYSSHRDLYEKVRQMLCALSFNVEGKKGTWCEFLLCNEGR